MYSDHIYLTIMIGVVSKHFLLQQQNCVCILYCTGVTLVLNFKLLYKMEQIFTNADHLCSSSMHFNAYILFNIISFKQKI